MSDQINFDDHPEKVDISTLNNFPTCCPGGLSRAPTSTEYEDLIQIHETRLRTKLRDLLDPKKHQYYSEVNLDMNRQEFFDLIDTLILESGMTLQEIEEDDHGSIGIRQKLLPVYLKMRERGFRHIELIT